MCDRTLEVHATLPADGFFTCYHHCRSCGGYVPGKLVERRVDTPDTPSGRHGVELRCRRCGYLIHFEADADVVAREEARAARKAREIDEKTERHAFFCLVGFHIVAVLFYLLKFAFIVIIIVGIFRMANRLVETIEKGCPPPAPIVAEPPGK